MPSVSACSYTIGITTSVAGTWAPEAMLLVIIMLYFFRAVYTEVGTALPFNGGSYTLLQAVGNRPSALFAAVLSTVAYVATGVVSAVTAVEYLIHVWPVLGVMFGSILVLALFAVLNLIGIRETGFTATVIFGVHLATLVLLMMYALVYFFGIGFSVYVDNANSPLQEPPLKSLFWGFSAATLGVTGFETSSNFIEEQEKGVFPKTLRNMWILALIFNPILSFLTVATVPMADLSKHSHVALSHLARITAGHWLEVWVAIDAFLVLSGSVITAYVGATGLFRRLAKDGVSAVAHSWLPRACALSAHVLSGHPAPFHCGKPHLPHQPLDDYRLLPRVHVARHPCLRRDQDPGRHM